MLCAPELICYDGEEEVVLPADQKTVEDNPEAKTFTQTDVNKFLAKDRREHEQKLKTLETSYETRLKDTALDAQGRQQLEVELEDLRSKFRTKEQQAAHEKKQQAESYEGKLKEASEAAQKYEGLYTDHVIKGAIQDAAKKEEAFNDEHIVGLLKSDTKLQEVLDENGKPTGTFAPMTKFMDVDAEGNPIETLRSPADVVKRMKELPSIHGCLFRANVVSGVGQGAATGGVTPGAGAQIDVTKLSPEQYRKIREENPGLLGLRPRK